MRGFTIRHLLLRAFTTRQKLCPLPAQATEKCNENPPKTVATDTKKKKNLQYTPPYTLLYLHLFTDKIKSGYFKKKLLFSENLIPAFAILKDHSMFTDTNC